MSPYSMMKHERLRLSWLANRAVRHVVLVVSGILRNKSDKDLYRQAHFTAFAGSRCHGVLRDESHVHKLPPNSVPSSSSSNPSDPGPLKQENYRNHDKDGSKKASGKSTNRCSFEGSGPQRESSKPRNDHQLLLQQQRLGLGSTATAWEWFRDSLHA